MFRCSEIYRGREPEGKRCVLRAPQANGEGAAGTGKHKEVLEGVTPAVRGCWGPREAQGSRERVCGESSERMRESGERR